jgi:hypothetical protein
MHYLRREWRTALATNMEKRSPSESVQQSVAMQTSFRVPVAVARLLG